MKITADTNILISATFWYGDSFKIIKLVERKIINLILSKNIIQEYSEVLKYDELQSKIKNKNLYTRYTLQKIISFSEIIEPKEKVNIIMEDTDDNKVLECAKEGKAEYIITNDNHLLKLKEFGGIKIITPAEFLRLIKNIKIL
ncbi:putative toxin-antitoxin system toxin component, PIN family [Candidatus Woesearchaeota archaeon]|nr:putative toxin-antitoxin system toxin component, PIN family [Candidatus Woesearchaeota archaeon]